MNNVDPEAWLTWVLERIADHRLTPSTNLCRGTGSPKTSKTRPDRTDTHIQTHLQVKTVTRQRLDARFFAGCASRCLPPVDAFQQISRSGRRDRHCRPSVAGSPAAPPAVKHKPGRPSRQALRQANSRRRESPHRRAVEGASRAGQALTIRTFPATAQRRRRPVSTTSRRPNCALAVRISITTLSHGSSPIARWSPARCLRTECSGCLSVEKRMGQGGGQDKMVCQSSRATPMSSGLSS